VYQVRRWLGQPGQGTLQAMADSKPQPLASAVAGDLPPATPEPPAAGLDAARATLKRLSTWVPIRSLARRHRHRIVEHLLALDAADRYLRFGYPASDEQIRRYALGIDFARDEVLGIFNRHLRLIALAHLAYEPAPQREGRPSMAEFGVSVLPHTRGRGLGARLFDAAALHARNRNVDTLFIHALSENTAMLRIARSAGATVEREGGESEAWLRLPPDTVSSHLGEAIERQLAELDFQFKRHAHVLTEFVESIAEVKAHFDENGGAGKQ